MTSKTKNIVLLVGFSLVLILAHKFAISNTLEVKKEYTKLNEESLLFKNGSKQLSLLKQKEKYYDSILNKYKLNGSSIQNNLLKTINTIAKESDIKVFDFLEPHTIVKDNLTHKTYQFSLEGNYNSILELIYKLEQDTKFGEIINLHFEKKKNYRTGRYYLQAKVLLRSFG